MYKDLSNNSFYPKTLMIRNHEGGMVWQVYHIENEREANILSSNAQRNGFYGTTLEIHQPEYEETWPGWRDTDGWKSCNG
jgi:hypothetical protein